MAEVDQVAIQRHTISVFRVIIVDKVKPSQILQFLVAPLPSLQASEIQARERTSIREAAGLLVDQLLECSEPGWFQAFINALKQSGYDALVRQLEGEEPTEVIKADKLYRALLSVFAPVLYKIKPSELIPYLVSTECLSSLGRVFVLCRNLQLRYMLQALTFSVTDVLKDLDLDVDEEEIRLREHNEGATKAADLLLERIHRRNEYYFLYFMEALRRNGYQSIVDEIEPAFNKSCNLEGAMNVVEQMPRVYQNNVGEAGSSQLDRQEDSDVQELRMQYSSLNTYSDTSVMAGNVPAASVTQADQLRSEQLKRLACDDKVWHLNEIVTPYQSQGVTPAGITSYKSQGVTPAGVTRYQSQGVTPAGITRYQSEGVTPAALRVDRIKELMEAAVPVKDEIDRKFRALRVMSMLREYRQPELWSYVSKQFVIEGQLDLSEVLSSKNLPDLLYLLEAGASFGITELFLNNNDVFAGEEDGRSLGAALTKMLQLSVLNVDSCSLTDKSWGQIVGGICQGCHQLETLCCEYNNLTDAGSEGTMKRLLTPRRQLKIRATACGLSENSVQRLKAECGDRFHWINYCYGHH